jgi:hypothetical protein
MTGGANARATRTTQGRKLRDIIFIHPIDELRVTISELEALSIDDIERSMVPFL